MQNIALSIDRGIARITLNRPERLNSLDDVSMRELRNAVEACADDQSVRALVMSGAGRAFCAGQDLEDPQMQKIGDKRPDIGDIVERHFKPLVLRLQELPFPTLAAVNGLAAGGGASLALACDLVVASSSAYFLQAFSRIGLTPDTGSTWFLTQRLGPARALGLTMLADRLPATKAAEWGLIWEAVDDENFSARIEQLSQQLAELPTTALVRTRQLVNTATTHTLEQQLTMEATYIRERGWSEDYQEGINAFQEKRKARFVGR